MSIGAEVGILEMLSSLILGKSSHTQEVIVGKFNIFHLPARGSRYNRTTWCLMDLGSFGKSAGDAAALSLSQSNKDDIRTTR